MNNTIIKFDFSLISKYRTELMGVSALMIIICHSFAYGCDFTNKFLVWFTVKCNYGVDVFLFLSGLGCYYSLSKSPSMSLLKWYKRRYIRIIKPYLTATILGWILLLIIGKFNFFSCLYDLSTLAFWTRHRGPWFIALIIQLYLILPFISRLLNHIKYRVVVSIVISLIVIELCKIDVCTSSDILNGIIYNIQWAYERSVGMLFGVALAPYIKMGRKTNVIYLIGVFLLATILVRFFSPKVFWGCFETVPIIICFTYIIHKIKSLKLNLKFTHWLGEVSLESYIMNGYAQYLSRYLAVTLLPLKILRGHYLEYVIVVIFGILGTYICYKIPKIVNSLYHATK